uniref:protein phosphatase 1 regulatory subunit 14B-like n=1 Tax=Myxine glutinosa TaxID=7769 RepID=UPI00358EBA81
MASCPRVCFGAAEGEGESRRPWKVTVRYDRKELQRRLQLEQWLEDEVAALHYEQEPSDLEIDVDDLLDLKSDEERAKKVRELIQGCAKDPEEFIRELVTRLKGMEKLSTPGRK